MPCRRWLIVLRAIVFDKEKARHIYFFLWQKPRERSQTWSYVKLRSSKTTVPTNISEPLAEMKYSFIIHFSVKTLQFIAVTLVSRNFVLPFFAIYLLLICC